jgi:hypothetical protein
VGGGTLSGKHTCQEKKQFAIFVRKKSGRIRSFAEKKMAILREKKTDMENYGLYWYKVHIIKQLISWKKFVPSKGWSALVGRQAGTQSASYGVG